MNEWHGPCEVVVRFNDGRLHSDFAQRILNEPVEVGSYDDANKARLNQPGYCPVRFSRRLSAFGDVVGRGLDIAMQNRPPLIGRRGELV
jgi:hypothetical protein